MRRHMGKREWYGLSGTDGEFAHCLKIFATPRRGRSQQHHVGSGNGSAHSIVEFGHPRYRRPVAEADHQFCPHSDTAALANNQTHDTGARMMFGHEVDERRCSFRSLEARFQDQCIGLVSPRYPGRPILRGNEPSAMFRRAEESRETSVRIKPRPTQPINGAIATDQCSCLAVADERVVFNTQRHAVVLFYNRVIWSPYSVKIDCIFAILIGLCSGFECLLLFYADKP